MLKKPTKELEQKVEDLTIKPASCKRGKQNNIKPAEKNVVTDRKPTEELLKDTKKLYQRLVENLGDHFVIYNHMLDGTLTYASPDLEPIFGICTKEVIGGDWTKLIKWNPEHLELAKKNIENMALGLEYKRMEMSFTHPDGKQRTVFISPYLVQHTDGSLIIEGIIEDITERKEIEKESQNIKQDLEYQVKKRTAEFEDMNTALKILLKKREEDKNEIENKIYYNFELLILPFIRKLEENLMEKENQNLLAILETNLKEILLPFAKKLSDPIKNLTPSEIQIASLIKQGLSSKEIAKTLNISIRTVTNHRNHIRKKIGLINKSINLRSFLSNQ